MRGLRLGLRRGFALVLCRFVMGDDATGGGAQDGVMAGHVTGDAANGSPGDAAGASGGRGGEKTRR
jgi:hypothetical protein